MAIWQPYRETVELSELAQSTTRVFFAIHDPDDALSTAEKMALWEELLAVTKRHKAAKLRKLRAKIKRRLDRVKGR